jgi:hypothetical protein
MMPDYVAVPIDYIKPSLNKLLSVLRDDRLPQIDEDVVIESIVDAVASVVEAQGEITVLSSNVLKGHDWCEAIHPDEEAEAQAVFLPEVISSCVVRFSQDLLREFKVHKLYQDGWMNYEYKELAGDSTIILRRRRNA